jgi:hypothetical protein
MKKILLVASSLLLSTQVQAAPPSPCTQANLIGNYVMYQAAINHHNHTGRCTINIVSGGALTGHCVFGHDANNNPGFSGPVYGTASMNTNCSAVATISFDPNSTTHIDSYFDLQFTPDKQSFVGDFNNTFLVEGVTNGTRYSTLLPATPAP